MNYFPSGAAAGPLSRMSDHRKCLNCNAPISDWFIIQRRGIPHGLGGHKTVYAHHIIAFCDSCRMSQLERYSHDCWGSRHDDPWDMYTWFLFDEESTQELAVVLDWCPAPTEPAHTFLQQTVPHLRSPYSAEEFAYGKCDYANLAVTLNVDSTLATIEIAP